MSFRWKTIIGLVIIQIFVMAMLIIASMSTLRTATDDAISQRAHTTAMLFASLSKDSLLSTDLATLDAYIQELLSQQGVRYVRVLDSSRYVLAEGGDTPALSRTFQQDIRLDGITDGIFDAEATVQEADIAFGYIQIGLDSSLVSSSIAAAWQRILFIALFSLILTLLFSIMFGGYLTRHLTALVHASVALAQGNLGYRLQINSKDELGKTAAAINSMAEKLQDMMQRIEEEKQRVRDIIDNSSSIITLKDTHGVIQLANRRFCDYFGVTTPSSISGTPENTLLPPELAMLNRKEDEQVVRSATTSEKEETIQLRDGNHTFLTSRFPLISEDEGVYGIGCIMTDITANKEVAADLIQKHRAVEESPVGVLITNTDSKTR